MKLPRDISSVELIKLLKIYGYSVVRQNGSHIRLTTFQNGQHHITIPNHHSINLGTLSSIIGDVAAHFQKSKQEIAASIFN